MATTTPNNGWVVPTSTDYVSQGAVAIETLGDAIDASVGTGLLAWQSWSPTLSGGWANGNGVWTAKYAKLGKLVFANGSFVVGSTTTKGTNLNVSLPVTAATNAAATNVSTNTVAGTATYLLWNTVDPGSQIISFFAVNASATYATRTAITSAIPATWATGDIIRFNVVYEAA